jgi:hypothetical protein
MKQFKNLIGKSLMGVDAIDQTICPSVLGMTKCSIAFGRWPHDLNIVIHIL